MLTTNVILMMCAITAAGDAPTDIHGPACCYLVQRYDDNADRYVSVDDRPVTAVYFAWGKHPSLVDEAGEPVRVAHPVAIDSGHDGTLEFPRVAHWDLVLIAADGICSRMIRREAFEEPVIVQMCIYSAAVPGVERGRRFR